MHHPARHQLSLGILYGTLTSLVASTATAAAKLLAVELSPWFIVWVQYGLCTLLLSPWLLRNGVGALRTSVPLLHIVRSLAGWLGFTTYYLSLPLISLVDASLLRAAAPLWVPLVVLLWLHQRLPWVRWIALISGFVGVMIILQPDPSGFNPGHILALIAGMALALSMTTTRVLSASEPANRVLFYYFALSFLASTPMALQHLQPVPLAAIPGLLWVGLSIFFTMFLYTRAYSHAPTSVVAPLSYLAIPAAVLLDWLIWSQLPTLWTWLGSAIIVLSGILAMVMTRPDKSEH